MKTTIDIDDELFRAAKIHAVHTRRPLRHVVEAALRSFLEGDGRSAPDPGAGPRMARLAEILRVVDTLPVLDARTPDEILGYDDQGGFD